MTIFRKPEISDSTGDAIPFYHDGTYHIFSLTPAIGTTVYPARLRTTWHHTISKDLVNWEDAGTAIYPGEGDEPDACGVWTGCAIFGLGQYHIFYTGYNYNIEHKQTICHAVSDDGIAWTKDPLNPILVADTTIYEELDWRDPYCFYNEEENCFWMLISARVKEGPPTRRGCVVLYKSSDLKNWIHHGPIYTPFHTNCPECAEMWKMDDTWFLSYSRFSEFGNTIYRVADTPYGPWKTPKADGIGGRRFYAAKSMADDSGRRFYFAWAHDRADQSDTGEWYWGGSFCIPHEVCINSDRELDVKMPKEIVDSFKNDLSWKYLPMFGKQSEISKNAFLMEALSKLSYGFFELNKKQFFFQCNMRIYEANDNFGILLKSNKEMSRCIQLVFEPGMQRVSLLNLPMAVDPFWVQSCTNIGNAKDPGPDGIRVAEKTLEILDGGCINVKIVVDNDMLEIFVDDKVAFTYRYYSETDYDIGFFSQDARLMFYDISFKGIE